MGDWSTVRNHSATESPQSKPSVWRPAWRIARRILPSTIISSRLTETGAVDSVQFRVNFWCWTSHSIYFHFWSTDVFLIYQDKTGHLSCRDETIRLLFHHQEMSIFHLTIASTQWTTFDLIDLLVFVIYDEWSIDHTALPLADLTGWMYNSLTVPIATHGCVYCLYLLSNTRTPL